MGLACCTPTALEFDEAITASRSSELEETVNDASCNFDRRELRELLKTWRANNPSGKVSKDQILTFFLSHLPAGNSPDEALLEELVASLDANHDGNIDFREAVLGLSAFMRGRPEEKVHMLFAALDVDSSGSVSKDELRIALHKQFRTSHISENDLDEKIKTVFSKADLDGDGTLSLSELLNLVDSDPELHLHFSVADQVFSFNACKTSFKKRRAALQVIADAKGLRELDAAFDAATATQVLRCVPALSPVAIGEFLGSKDDDGFANECAKLFFASFDLSGMQLDEAIRCMSKRLCLPGEAQQIDRLIESFAGVYCRDNPGILSDTDAAYLLAFSIVMLNADAHTATLTNKMSRAEFVKNSGLAVPKVDKALLENIYDRVVATEIRLGAVDDLGGSLEDALNHVGNDELTKMMRAINNSS